MAELGHVGEPSEWVTSQRTPPVLYLPQYAG